MDGLEPLSPWQPPRKARGMNVWRPIALLGTLLSRFRGWEAARRLRAGTSLLHGMSNRELKDIGICRSDLANAVVQSRRHVRGNKF